MERMGHSTINFTLGTYGHLLPAVDERIDELLSKRYTDSRATSKS